MKLLGALVALAVLFASAPAKSQVADSPAIVAAEWRLNAGKRVLAAVNRSRAQMRAALKAAGPVGPEDRVVLVGLTVARTGKIISTKIVRSSGNAAIDQGVEQIVARSGPLPPYPARFTNPQVSVTVPVRIKRPDVIAAQTRR